MPAAASLLLAADAIADYFMPLRAISAAARVFAIIILRRRHCHCLLLPPLLRRLPPFRRRSLRHYAAFAAVRHAMMLPLFAAAPARRFLFTPLRDIAPLMRFSMPLLPPCWRYAAAADMLFFRDMLPSATLLPLPLRWFRHATVDAAFLAATPLLSRRHAITPLA